MKQHIFQSIVDAEYQESNATELEEFLENPSPEALQAAFMFALQDGVQDMIWDSEPVENALVKCMKDSDYSALGLAFMEQCLKSAQRTLENVDMADSKAEDVTADYIAVDLAARMRDLG